MNWYDITPEGEAKLDKVHTSVAFTEWSPTHLDTLILADVNLQGFPQVYPYHIDELEKSQSEAGVAIQGRLSRKKLRSRYKSLVKKGYLKEVKKPAESRIRNVYGPNFAKYIEPFENWKKDRGY